MNILIVTNFAKEELEEDRFFAKSFTDDGHKISLVDLNFDSKIEPFFDVIIKRNVWYESEKSTGNFYEKSAELDARISRNQQILAINFNGKFDSGPKTYLADLFDAGFPAIPTARNLGDFAKLPSAEKYLLKPLRGYDGIGQKKFAKNEIAENFDENKFVIQPVMSFAKEIQFYFVGQIFEYALSYSPSKVSNYPPPQNYIPSESELKTVRTFAKLNENLLGVQRIDFIKTADGKLLLLEIEDSSPHLELGSVSPETREKFLRDYKNMVYAEFAKM